MFTYDETNVIFSRIELLKVTQWTCKEVIKIRTSYSSKDPRAEQMIKRNAIVAVAMIAGGRFRDGFDNLARSGDTSVFIRSF